MEGEVPSFTPEPIVVRIVAKLGYCVDENLAASIIQNDPHTGIDETGLTKAILRLKGVMGYETVVATIFKNGACILSGRLSLGDVVLALRAVQSRIKPQNAKGADINIVGISAYGALGSRVNLDLLAENEKVTRRYDRQYCVGMKFKSNTCKAVIHANGFTPLFVNNVENLSCIWKRILLKTAPFHVK